MESNIFLHQDKLNSGVPRLSAETNFQSAIDTAIAKELNTYRNWGMFGVVPDAIYNPAKTDKNGNVISPEKVDYIDPYNGQYGANSVIGTKSLFNNVNAVRFTTDMQIENSAPLMDNAQIREQIRRRGDCTIKELVRASENHEMGRAIYRYADFMFCKHLGRISNNYLVTLRRFPFPCGDHINFTLPRNANERKLNEHMPDIGRMVTWIGTPGNDMGNILKYSVKMPYKEMSSEFQDLQDTAESGGLLGSIFNLSSNQYTNNAILGVGGANTISLTQKISSSTFGMFGKGGKAIGNILSSDKIIASPPDNNSWRWKIDDTKTYGNADVITKTHRRQSPQEGGLEFEQNISLVFDYELRSFDGINGRAAFLDLIANILAVTYTNGKFWGGEYRGGGQSQLNAFTNLPIYNMVGHNSNEPFSWSSLVNATMDSLSEVGKSFNNGQPIDSIGGVMNAIKNLASNMGKMLLGGALNALGRPEKQALNSLLNPAPVGLWHLTIGNPKHPIMTMGNMILDGVNIEHYGPLGYDDFPTGIKVEITLKHAKPRDASEIENMYLMGDYRIYQPMGKKVMDMYNAAANYKGSDSSYVGDQTQLNKTVNTNNVSSTDEETKNVQLRNKYIMKETGTYSTQNLIWGAAEASTGSQKTKSKEESERDRQQLAAMSKSK